MLRRGDISSKDDVKRLASEVGSKETKGIHLLVNNGMTSIFTLKGMVDAKINLL